MPFTFNGIGTHYYGARNRSARADTCGHCGRSATLSSYDTREWFCFVFIPLIPLTKYRILDECSSCRRHQRIKAGEFQTQLAAAVDPLREAARRAPRDPEPQLALVQTLLGWEMRAEAERELAEARTRLPENVDLILLDAQLAIDAADLERALPLYENASHLAPQNPAVTYGHGWLLHQLGRHEEAVPLLQRAGSAEETRAGATYLLAISLMKLSRWNEALYAFQQLVGVEPAYGEDKELLRLSHECKRRLGYLPSEAERRAGRRWWPFGRRAKRVKLEAQPRSIRPSIAIAGIVIALLVAGVFVVDAWKSKTHIVLYVDNALEEPITVAIDGRKIDVIRGRTLETLGEGAHEIVVSGPDGKEIERHAFTLEELSLVDSITTERFFVYNVGGRRIYRRARHGYAQRAEDSEYSEEMIGMQRWIEQRDVDFVFENAPDQISVSSSASRVTRVSFTAADDVDLATYALIRLNEGKKEEAALAIETAVAAAPCNAQVRRSQVYLAGLAGATPEEAAALALQWIGDCPEDDLEAHRAYQDASEAAGRREELVDEYRRMVAREPLSAMAHYLYGRTLDDPEQALAEHRLAIELDPELAWGHIALAHALRLMDRHAEAFDELAIATEIPGRDDATLVLYAAGGIAAGRTAEAWARIDRICSERPDDLAAASAAWLLAAVSGEWAKAEEIQKKLAAYEEPGDAWWRTTQLQRARGDADVEARIEQAREDQSLAGAAAHLRVARKIEGGDFEGALVAVEEGAEWVDPVMAALFEAYAAAGLLLEGNAPEAERALASAWEKIEAAEDSEAKRGAAAVVRGLRGELSPEAVLVVARATDQVEHGWFVAAVRAAAANDRVGAAANLDRCIRASSYFAFPYLEARAFAERVKPRG